MNILGKRKDVKAVRDYFECTSELWPQVKVSKKSNRADEVGGSNKGKGHKNRMSNEKNYLPPTCYTFFKAEKRANCESLYGIKVWVLIQHKEICDPKW